MIMVCADLAWELILGWGGRVDRPAWCPVFLGLRVVDGQRLGCRSDDEGLSDRGEAAERGGEVGGPGPAGVDSDPDLALAVDDPGGGVQQPVAQLFDLDPWRAHRAGGWSGSRRSGRRRSTPAAATPG